MSKYIQDNWAVFEGEKFGLKVQGMQILQLKHKIQEQDWRSGQFSWLLKSLSLCFLSFITLSDVEVSADNEVCSGHCYHRAMQVFRAELQPYNFSIDALSQRCIHTPSGRAAGVCLAAVVSNTGVCCLVSCLGVRLYHRCSGNRMEQLWEEQLCCKDGLLGSTLAGQMMWSLLCLEGVALDGTTDDIGQCQGCLILFLLSAPLPVSVRKIMPGLLVQKHPMFPGFFVF